MKTLLEKLTPSNLAILNEANTKYPASVSSLIKKLGSNYSWLELSYNDVIMLLCYLGVTDYGPNGVKSVFED
jgi:hypothetical protein